MTKHLQIAVVVAALVTPSIAFSDELSEALKLADAGDARAGPILFALVTNQQARIDGLNGHLIPMAFGKLKYRPAAPLLAKVLMTSLKPNEYATEMTLNALAEIGDTSVTNVLLQYLGTGLPPTVQTAVRRVLIQLEDADPVPGLLRLLDKETYEPERSDIIEALAKHKDERVVKRLAEIAAESESAFMRREAIDGLSNIGDKRSLLALASLLDLTFSKDLKAEWGWKGIPDFRTYFPDLIERRLRWRTKQDFGTNRGQWEAWIKANIEPSGLSQ
jgi:HEAT repeat protein